MWPLVAVLATHGVIEVVDGEPGLSEKENAFESPRQIRIGRGGCGAVVPWWENSNWSRMVARSL